MTVLDGPTSDLEEGAANPDGEGGEEVEGRIIPSDIATMFQLCSPTDLSSEQSSRSVTPVPKRKGIQQG